MTLHVIPVSAYGAGSMALVGFFLILATMAVALRVYCIYLIGRELRVHDLLIFPALLLSWGHITIIFIEVVVGGMGHYIDDVPKMALVTLSKLFFAANLTWLCATTIVKTSVLLLYLDIFKVHRRFKQIVQGYLFFIAMFFGGFLVSVMLLCQPISYLWNPVGAGYCGDATKSQIATSIINIIVDFVIVTSPIPVVYRLQMSRAKKLRTIGVFTIGYLIFLVNIARLVLTLTLSQVDLTQNLLGPAICTSLEVNLGIISACLPVTSPLFSVKHRQAPVQQLKPKTSLLWGSQYRDESKSQTVDGSESSRGQQSSDELVATQSPSEGHHARSGRVVRQHDNFDIFTRQVPGGETSVSALDAARDNKFSQRTVADGRDGVIMVTNDVTIQSQPSSDRPPHPFVGHYGIRR